MPASTRAPSAAPRRDVRGGLTSRCVLRACSTSAALLHNHLLALMLAEDMPAHVRDPYLTAFIIRFIQYSPRLSERRYHQNRMSADPSSPPCSSDHFHTDLVCDYTLTAPGHSALIGISLDGRGLYGQYETTGTAPTDLDACNGHYGIVPTTTTKADSTGASQTFTASSSVSVYHCRLWFQWFFK